MLPQNPLRFLLADDAGAGNATLLAGVKELEKERADLALELNTVKSNWTLFQQHQALAAEDEEPGWEM